MIIGIVGFIGCGKGTVGDYLSNEWLFHKDAFANPLKDAVSIIFGWDREMLEEQTDQSREWREKIDENWSKIVGYDLSPRYALQLFGTECIRNVFHANVWSESLIRRSKARDENTVVTDCRFVNEIKAIRKSGGKIFKVSRGNDPEWMKSYLRAVNTYDLDMINFMRKEKIIPHVSETDWIGSVFDYTIENDGTIDDLYDKVDKIMEKIL